MQEYTPTPDFYNDYIAHYGVKGMKWGKKKVRPVVDENASDAYKQLASMSEDKYQALLKKVKLVGKKKGSSSKSKTAKEKTGKKSSASSSAKKTSEKSEETKSTKSTASDLLESIRKPQSQPAAKKSGKFKVETLDVDMDKLKPQKNGSFNLSKEEIKKRDARRNLKKVRS